MMAPEYYTFTGRRIPPHVTHVVIDKALKFVPAEAFRRHPNIEEVIFRDGVKKIEERVFQDCSKLRRVIMPGVKRVERYAFHNCEALTYIECGKLEIIEELAFSWCTSLSSIDLPSIKILESGAFSCCRPTNVKFGKDLESIGGGAFDCCLSLKRIALPLKDDMITHDDTFLYCDKLHHVDLVGGVYETVAALLSEEWKSDMKEEIDAINHILPNAAAGGILKGGEKSQAIRTWIKSVLRKYIYYKAEHRRYVNEAAATLKLTLPHDIVLKNILPFVAVALPSDTFEGED